MKVHSVAGQQQRITNQTPKNEEREVYVGSLCPTSIYMRVSRNKVAYNVYTQFHKRKNAYMLENQVFGPRYLIQGILVQGNWFEAFGLRY